MFKTETASPPRPERGSIASDCSPWRPLREIRNTAPACRDRNPRTGNIALFHSIATTHRFNLAPRAEIWSLFLSSRELQHRAGKIASGERGSFSNSVPSRTTPEAQRKMRKTISPLQLRRAIHSKCRHGTLWRRIERNKTSFEHLFSRQIRPLAAIASGVQHRTPTRLRSHGPKYAMTNVMTQ